MVMMLLNAVRLMLSAESPLQRWAMRLEVAPPGQAAKIMIPTASGPLSPKSMQSPKPISGNRRI